MQSPFREHAQELLQLQLIIPDVCFFGFHTSKDFVVIIFYSYFALVNWNLIFFALYLFISFLLPVVLVEVFAEHLAAEEITESDHFAFLFYDLKLLWVPHKICNVLFPIMVAMNSFFIWNCYLIRRIYIGIERRKHLKTVLE